MLKHQNISEGLNGISAGTVGVVNSNNTQQHAFVDMVNIGQVSSF